MSVCIEVGKYAIESSSTCWQLCKKAKTKDGEEWRPFSYYKSFESAMIGLYELNLRTCDARSVLELRETMLNASKSIIDTCTPLRAENALQLTGE